MDIDMASEYSDDDDTKLILNEGNIMSEMFDDDLTDYFDGYDIEDVDECNQKILEGLRKTCENVNWDVVEERYSFICSVVDLIGGWIYHWDRYLPDIRDIFRPEQIDYLLKESVINRLQHLGYQKSQLIKFVFRAGYRDQPDVDEDGRPLTRRTTALHHVTADTYCKDVMYLFHIYNGADNGNFIDESELTHFHVACWKGFYPIVDKFLELGQDPNLLVPKTGDSPLQFAVAMSFYRKVLVELLLRKGANPNLANAKGTTALHVICKEYYDYSHDLDLVNTFFELSSENNHPVLINAQDNEGNTPLQLAAGKGNKYVVEYLLRHGADPNMANAEGLIALHAICKENYEDPYMANAAVRFIAHHAICERDYEEHLVNAFFELSRENNHPVLINAQDNAGNTPLQWAAGKGNKNVVEYLLRRGADSSLANAKGLTPLHIICKRIKDDDLVDSFFDVNDDLQQTVRIDVLDNVGMTPLKWAVASLMPHAVDVLLDRGADISQFTFPAEEYLYPSLEDDYEWTASELLRQTSGFFAVVERLERRGYDLGRSDALIIMTFFAKNRLFLYPEYPAELESCWHDQEFVKTMREIMINPNLSLYDLMQLRPEEAKNRVTYAEYFELACTKKLEELPVWRHLKPCLVNLCEKLARGFFRRWAVNFILELTRYRLPILCCDAIVGQLTNKDFRLICMAASVQNE